MPQNRQINGWTQERRLPPELVNAGTPASGVTAEEFGYGPFRLTKLTLTNVAVTITRTSGTVAGNSGAGKPGLLYTLPEALVAILGGTCSLTITTATMADSANGVTGIGTVQNTATPATLAAAGEATLIPSATTAIATNAGSRSASSTSTALVLVDGTTTPGELYFNYGTADDISATGTMTLNGTVTFCWCIMGER